jgi:hypothetical protein
MPHTGPSIPRPFTGRILRSFLVSSAQRNVVAFPTPQTYRVVIPAQKAVGAVFLAMANFVSPVGAPLAAALQISEMAGSGLSWTNWPGGYDTTVACIPLPVAGTRILYEAAEPSEVDVIRMRDVGFFTNTTSFTFTWLDENGAPLAAMPEHVMRICLVGEDVV